MAKTKRKHYWFLLGLVGTLLAAPNALFVRLAARENFDPFLFNVLRFAAVALVTTPYLVTKLRRVKRSARSSIWKSGLYMSVAVISYVWAIKLSQASYVSMLVLLSPIVFVILSAQLTGEQISRRSMFGITLGALGATVMVFLPVALEQDGTFVFYPAATLLSLVNVVSFPLAIIHYKKANDKGVPILSIMSTTSWIIVATNLLLWLATGAQYSEPSLHQTGTLVGIGASVLYSGIVVALLARTFGVLSYEHIGSATSSALGYLETFLAILLPVMLLGEHLSVEMVIGGALTLLGVAVIEFHRSRYHKHLWTHRNH